MPDQDRKPTCPLLKLEYAAQVVGLFAQVTVKQFFNNQSEQPIEAVYVFPLPEEASVTGATLQIGQKEVVAELKEKKQARQEYEDAVSAGHHGGLLEQKRPNIFTINVGGIEPGEDIQAIVTYTQPVPWQDGGGRFTIPTVVPPRFIPGAPTGKSGGGWAPDTDQVPDASQITPVVSNDGVPYTVSVTARFDPGFDCSVRSPSHELLLPFDSIESGGSRELKLDHLTPDRDIIV